MPHGVTGGGEPRALDAGAGLWAIVATVPGREYSEAALAVGLQDLDWVGRQAMAHEAVVEHFLYAPAVLPMQLFTLFTTDERALEHVVGERSRLNGILARIEHQLEWGLRLTLDEDASRVGTVPAGADSSGSAYLGRKRDLLDAARVRLAKARAGADRVYKAMALEATQALRRSATEQAAPGSRLLIDAAFLVPGRRAAAFRSTLRRSARALGASGVVASLTGPWPPYNFITPPSRGKTGAARRRDGSTSHGRSGTAVRRDEPAARRRKRTAR